MANHELPAITPVAAPPTPTEGGVEHINEETGEVVYDAEVVPSSDLPDPADTRDPWAEEVSA